MKIIVLTTSLSRGGITSFMIPLVNFLIEENHDVTLAYTIDEGNYIDRISNKVHKLQYKTYGKYSRLFRYIRKNAILDVLKIVLRKKNAIPKYSSIQRVAYIDAEDVYITDQKFDIAISTAEGFCNAVVANSIIADKRIGWIHPDMKSLGLDIRKGTSILDKLDYIVSVSQSGCATLKAFFPNAEKKFVHIDNMIDSDYIRMKSMIRIDDMYNAVNGRTLVTVCRIANESKRLDRIVSIADNLKEQHFNFKWYIIGDGPDYNMLDSLIKSKSLTDKVILLGARNNPFPYIKKADYFVLTSQYEGKPVVVEEAKVLHTPIIVTNYSSARNQVTEKLGIVVDNSDENLIEQISNVIKSDSQLERIRKSNASYIYDNTLIKEQLRTILYN